MFSTLFAGNIGNVPLVLIAALCRDKNNPFGSPEKCSQDGTVYISFGQWVCFLFIAVLQSHSIICFDYELW